ncbi:ECF transporter S component [Ammoniphilus oxalaticus]|uniref:ECF transporter S component n=1 Tax=Ammoniphilus oxalaticus TaxID=66863 RepID=A0A419SF67_9BACL|nr:ECF transporter S component [Ammoniphilus oxalaticus]RKD22086.1 ECF transporter S component [Ammoniphilus oxalaticus]
MSDKQLTGGNRTKRTALSAFFILFVIPLTIFVGIFFLNDRKYYFISLLIITYTLIPFAMVFEKREPQARELIIIAVLASIGVAGRAAFFMLPQFKPVVAIVIITGISLGAEAGFLVGATVGFVSNFFFGQGPWTPWQMFCFGIIGFLAGILFQKGWLKKTKLSLCIYGGLATFFIYGGLINLGSLLMFTAEFSWKALLAAYISGFGFDLVHTIATVFFLYVISQPFIEKIDRMKVKYGLLDGRE